MRRKILIVAVATCVALLLAPAAWAAKARTRLVSKTSGGAPAYISGTYYSGQFLSATGRFVAFHSTADNLPGGATDEHQIYVHDRVTGKTRLVSRTAKGKPGNDESLNPSISADGRFVAFESHAGNLPGANGEYQIYVHDRATGKTRLVSRNNQGQVGASLSQYASISANGRYVAFQTDSANLPGATGDYQVYVHDRKSGKTRLASRNSKGQAADGDSLLAGPSLSKTGRFLVFSSFAVNLPGGSGTLEQIYVRDLKKGKTVLVSKTSSGQAATSDSQYPAISSNGRVVAFTSYAPNLPAGDGLNTQVYVYDRTTKKTKLVSKTSGGQAAEDSNFGARPSGDGRLVVFASTAANLPGANGEDQIYLHDRKTGKTRLMSRNDAGAASDKFSRNAILSLDGRFVGFTTRASNLPGGNGVDELVYVRGPLS